jgi:hypothetical protein
MRVRNRFVIGCRGQSTIEFAFMALFLLPLLALGVFEFGRAIQAKNIVTNMSREGTNMASRPMSSATPQDIMDALAFTADPLQMSKTDPNKSLGMMYITQVRGRYDGQIEVVTQYKWIHPGTYQPNSIVLDPMHPCSPWINGVCNPPNPKPTANLSTLHLERGDLANGQVAYVTEVFYGYPVIFRNIINYSPQIYSITIF